MKNSGPDKEKREYLEDPADHINSWRRIKEKPENRTGCIPRHLGHKAIL